MRIRTTKPDFWRSSVISEQPREVRLLLIGLKSYVDDNGVGLDDYRQIAADLFPLESDPLEAREFVREGLARLSRGSLITRYTVAGVSYIYIPGWDGDQRVDKPNKPRYPTPDAADDSMPSNYGEPREGSRDPREELANPPEDSAPGVVEYWSSGVLEKEVPSPDGEERSEPEPRPDVDQLCQRLADRVHANGAKATISKTWRDEARRLLDRDRRDFDEAMSLIDWATSHSFWSSNILSIPKFREKYDRLRLQSQQRERANGHVPYQNPPAEEYSKGGIA